MYHLNLLFLSFFTEKIEGSRRGGPEGGSRFCLHPEDGSTSIIWNNKNIRINRIPVFYRRFFDKNLTSICQLRLHLNNAESLDLIRTDFELNCNFLVWAGLRSAIPVSLRG